MKKEFSDYLNSINLSKVMNDAIIENYKILALAANVDEFDDIFFSDMISKTGIREYFSLWGFTQTIFGKIAIGKGADLANKIVLFKAKQNIARFVINDYNYDLSNPNENSSLECTIRTFDMETPFGISASGVNCSNLMKVARKYFITALNT